MSDRELLRMVAGRIEEITRQPRSAGLPDVQDQLRLSKLIYEHLGRTDIRDDY